MRLPEFQVKRGSGTRYNLERTGDRVFSGEREGDGADAAAGTDLCTGDGRQPIDGADDPGIRRKIRGQLQYAVRDGKQPWRLYLGFADTDAGKQISTVVRCQILYRVQSNHNVRTLSGATFYGIDELFPCDRNRIYRKTKRIFHDAKHRHDNPAAEENDADGRDFLRPDRRGSGTDGGKWSAWCCCCGDEEQDWLFSVCISMERGGCGTGDSWWTLCGNPGRGVPADAEEPGN